MDSVSAKKSKKIRHNTAFTTREMVLAGMFAAVLAVISQLSIPTPAGVPVTIQVFGVALVGAVMEAGTLFGTGLYPDRGSGASGVC